MSTEKKSLIKDLKTYKDEWRLTVKLLHSWKQSTSFGGDTLECVLVDESYMTILVTKLSCFSTDVMGQVTDLAAVATVQVKGIDTKRVNLRLHDERYVDL
ncbi:hypothetical protein Bca52824_000723 [Brassica carinata]|uniref:Replication protein A 70 kDa DNA-binding subunit B/D first OB fold domain-containing protein n=1 Tax=Brassica carinata TaxID=52824 RepID=A0A8X8BCM1_BRACI|nr:hypothetical protein Bca52824_000723 [Brassica carinata]